MYRKSLAAVVAIAVFALIAVSVIGQEDPLPVVAPRYVAPEVTIVEPVVVLASEPVHEYQPPTILDAARNNDYLTFDALYTAAKKRGEDVSRFDTLHELWTYSITDPIGAFYGPELHARLARAYPGFAAYIEPYRIVDDRGQVFYPASETRTFLLARAVEAKPTPRVQVAEAKPVTPKPTRSVTPSVARRPAARVATAPAPPPARSLAPAREDKPAVKAEPAPAPAAEVPVPVVVKQPVAVPAKPAAAQPAPKSPVASRGVLLLVIGLIGIGLLALILRTPKEEPTVIKPNNVEPIRKPQATPPPPPPDSRATGSHG